jgi:hypothetical protein
MTALLCIQDEYEMTSYHLKESLRKRAEFILLVNFHNSSNIGVLNSIFSSRKRERTCIEDVAGNEEARQL